MRRWLLVGFVLSLACHPPPVAPPPIARAASAVDASVNAPAPVADAPCRSAHALPEGGFSPPAIAAPTAPAVVRACDATTRALRRRLEALLGPLDADSRSTLIAPLAQCYAAGAGAWTFAVAQATTSVPDESTGRVFAVRVRPVYLAADGVAHPGAAVLRVEAGVSQFVETVAVDRVGVVDWDGDGRGELYLHESHAQEEGGAEPSRLERWWTFTARDATPREYTALAARAAFILDVDGDRRPDLLLRSPWIAVGPCGIAEVDNPGPLVAMHARPDGAFDGDDDVAHAWIARACNERPSPLLVPVPEAPDPTDLRWQPSFRVACARWWGRSADDVAAEITRTYPRDEASNPYLCFPREELLRIARIDPPSAFRLTCAP